MTAGRKPREGVLTFTQILAHHMRDMRPAYAGPDATPHERRCANLRYGNELASKKAAEILAHGTPEDHARRFAIEASRLRRTANQVAKTEIRTPFGRHVNTDYAEQLQQAAFALRLEAHVLRQGGAA